MGLLGISKKEVGTVTWRGQDIPVTADVNQRGHAVGFEKVQIVDMPQEMRDAVRHWATEIHIVKMRMPPTGCAYYLEDIEEFLAWERDLAKRLQEAEVCCAECGLRYGSRKPNLDGVTFCHIGPCPICGRDEGVTVDMARDFGELRSKP